VINTDTLLAHLYCDTAIAIPAEMTFTDMVQYGSTLCVPIHPVKRFDDGVVCAARQIGELQKSIERKSRLKLKNNYS